VILISRALADQYADELAAAAAGLGLVRVGAEGIDGDLASVRGAFLSADLFPDLWPVFEAALLECPNLEWLQSPGSGTDLPLFQRLHERGVVLTNAPSAAGPAIAQTAIMFMLMLSRSAPRFAEHQRARHWNSQRRQLEDLTDARLTVLGMGAIGSEVARLASELGMRVVGVRRKHRGDEPCETWEPDRFAEALERADWLAVAMPLTDESHRILDRKALERLPAGARIINVGRGELIDEAAMIEALQSGRLAGAALDVFETEPLPAESPLWEMPNVIVTPHCAGLTQSAAPRATRIFLENLARWHRGEALHGRVVPPALKLPERLDNLVGNR
jgi:phosphoglycerate dehydrogenase-like enzyme